MPEKTIKVKNYWAANLRFLRLRKGLSQEELAQQLNISRSKLNAHENGQTVNPVVEDLVRFSEYFRFSIDALIKIDLQQVKETQLIELQSASNEYISGKRLKVLATTVNISNEDNIEFVTQKARAGYLSGFSDPEFISKLPVFHLPFLPKDRKFRMFPTVGDSMYPIPEDSLVIAQYVEDWTSIKERIPCIVITKDDGIVFKFVTNKIRQSRALLLESLNPVYRPYEVNVSEVLEVWQFVNYISDTIPPAEVPLIDMARSLSEIKSDLKRLALKGN
ncbi:MAG TPA: helix-turn-helix domain-containing protein [Flavipsychrobacter sp.]|nr:helix-turn-helix domain-containing protein [Flavipsychrobacter sp.]